jgi:uncharacterized membrane protein
MTDTRDMLDASPASIGLDVDELAAAIDACLNCVQTCTSCADADLVEDDVDEMRTCIARCQSCADLCVITARALSRPAHWDRFVVHRLLQACSRQCGECAEECARHAAHHRHCAICERACRACARACDAVLEAEAFEELEKLAGA